MKLWFVSLTFFLLLPILARAAEDPYAAQLLNRTARSVMKQRPTLQVRELRRFRSFRRCRRQRYYERWKPES